MCIINVKLQGDIWTSFNSKTFKIKRSFYFGYILAEIFENDKLILIIEYSILFFQFKIKENYLEYDINFKKNLVFFKLWKIKSDIYKILDIPFSSFICKNNVYSSLYINNELVANTKIYNIFSNKKLYFKLNFLPKNLTDEQKYNLVLLYSIDCIPFLAG